MCEPRGHAAMSGRDPAAADPAGRRLRRGVHRGVGLPADVRPRHDRRRHRAGRDRHGRGHRAGHPDPARHPGRPGHRRRRRARRRRAQRHDPERAVVRAGAGPVGRRPGPRAGSTTTSRSAATSTRSSTWPRSASRSTARRSSRSSPPGLAIMDAINESDRAGASDVARDQRLPPRLLRRPRIDRRALAARDGDLPRLVRPLALRHRHERPDGPAARPRRAAARIATSSTSRSSAPASSAGSSARRPSADAPPFCPRSPAGPGSPAPPSTCSIPLTRSRPVSPSEEFDPVISIRAHRSARPTSSSQHRRDVRRPRSHAAVGPGPRGPARTGIAVGPAVRAAALDAAADAVAAAADELTDADRARGRQAVARPAARWLGPIAILRYYAQQVFDPIGSTHSCGRRRAVASPAGGRAASPA